ncbi:craniofacial development protein 1 [Nasonia vitripennis]|uniref:Craniofacial development protein 1 n=1 Tax=Nasonia vitripennis TaxID=7425 RepID=A0A7M7QM05_NASVI|nr:craniofacial development protein 1 [Nasonia vitripennis]XP_016839727.1 craniofacial development protein 1 [Nasonia vitripennis]XP_032451800.1 craniofacial development protein 1 [Nasonia vitripennis]XP_032451801.1 craniofacial development protein 1 [Nasonia vitripennis]
MGDKDYDSSDSDDSDFVAPQDELSDDSIQSDYDSEGSEGSDHESSNDKKKKNTKTRKHKATKSVGRKTRSTRANKDDELSGNEKDDSTTTIDEKERADSLWASFLSDTATPSKLKSSNTSTSSKTPSCDTSPSTNKTDVPKSSSTSCSADQSDTFNATKTEDSKSPITSVTVKDNSENTVTLANEKEDKPKDKPKLPILNRDIKRKGITSVLGSLNKKTKLSTLEKSKLDWNQFKEENNLKEEINTFNRGKNGYLEKQDFLQRADSRQFEIEKQLRAGKRGSR